MDATESIPIIELNEADPRARGRTYGEAARERIQGLLEVYRDLFLRLTGESWEGIVRRGDPLIVAARSFAPDLMEEIVGIAEGADRSVEDVFLLNARSEILFSPKALGMECTAVLCLPQVTRERETLLAQNWDWYRSAQPCQVILKIAGRNGIPPLVTFTEAGQLAKIGMNGAGLALVVNNLVSDQPRTGVPWIFLTRRVLESGHLTKAIGCILTSPRAHSLNFMLAQADGEGLDLETSPAEEHILWPQKGLLAHTNHYLEPGRRFRDLKPSLDPYPSTYLRFRRAQSALQERRGRLGSDDLEALFADHFDAPFSVCMHENPEVEPWRRVVTCLSIIMNPTRRQIRYTLGNPCAGPFQTLEFGDFLNRD
jgi:isopenicillin-N N-acyltransferase-like protein